MRVIRGSSEDCFSMTHLLVLISLLTLCTRIVSIKVKINNIHSKHEKTTRQIPTEGQILQNTEHLTTALQNCQAHQIPGSVRNCHSQEDPETWQLNAIRCPGCDVGREEGREVETKEI